MGRLYALLMLSYRSATPAALRGNRDTGRGSRENLQDLLRKSRELRAESTRQIARARRVVEASRRTCAITRSLVEDARHTEHPGEA